MQKARPDQIARLMATVDELYGTGTPDIPVGAPWEITDQTDTMYELRFLNRPGAPVMLYKGEYAALCEFWRRRSSYRR